MKPILITTPRTGSTVICKLLGNLAKQHFGFKGILHEPFTITELFKPEYTVTDNIISLSSFNRVGYKWYTSKRAEKMKVMSMLVDNYDYMIKLFPIDLEPEISAMIEQKYDVILLERYDKVEQMLSWIRMFSSNISHFGVDDTKTVDEMTYDSTLAYDFIRHLDAYYAYKTLLQGKYRVIYYEDFVAAGCNERAIIDLLDLKITSFLPMTLTTKPTPYITSLEDIISNKDVWLRDKNDLISRISRSASD